MDNNDKLERLWKRIGLIFLILAIVIVAGPQILVLLGLR
jgi:hypothetical protein